MRSRVAGAGAAALVALAGLVCAQDGQDPRGRPRRGRELARGPEAALSVILGRPTDRGVTLGVRSERALEAYVEYGLAPDAVTSRTAAVQLAAGAPTEVELVGLAPDTRYAYRLVSRASAGEERAVGPTYGFHTQRARGGRFVFTVQGDSHPEREGKMFDPALYVRALEGVARDGPDFHIALGDDFSIERLIERGPLTQASVDEVYARQRGYLGLVGRGAPLFLVNGNHEQAARYLLDGTPGSAAVLAGRARISHFPLPAPDAFYGGDAEPVEHVGLPRDYYAWTWGDALFVVLDPYWHSPVAVDNEATTHTGEGGRGRRGERGGEGAADGDQGGGAQGRGGGRERGRGGKNRSRDLWAVGLGDAQYAWLTRTLEESRARFKFVFAHHVLGTGRGGVELAGLYEWGGRDRDGADRFAERRPGWALPIHALFVRTGVTIFFQGHDHLFARQELDGVVYQSTPNPADATYTAFNRESYRSGDVRPNSGYLRVTVGPDEARVEYVRVYLPSDEGPGRTHGAVELAYGVPARDRRAEGGAR